MNSRCRAIRCHRAASTTRTGSSCARCCSASAARSWISASCPTIARERGRPSSRRARRADVIVTSGGVSVGEEDHVKPAVEAEGALELWQIAMKPGKPFAFGHVRDVPFIGLARQSGIELRDLPAVRTAVHPAAPGGRRREPFPDSTCAPTSTGHGPTSAASSCACVAMRTTGSISFRRRTRRSLIPPPGRTDWLTILRARRSRAAIVCATCRLPELFT